MSARLASTLAAVVLTASTAFTTTAAAQQFKTDTWYGGPRIWIGGLNGATAFGAQIEKGFTKPGAQGSGIISGGVGVDYYSYSSSFIGYGWKFSVIPVSVFGAYHFAVESNKKLDPYLGVALVYSIYSSTYTSPTGGTTTLTSPNSSSLGFAGYGGLRYFMSDNFAISGQLGFGYGTLGVGVSWKF
jgi:hypothetical protein